jgi:hypothetical protein
MIDLVQTTHQIIQAIQPVLGPVGAGAAGKAGGIAAESAWNWIKSKLTSAGATEAVHALEQTPTDDTAQKMVQLYIQQAAERDAAFREELLKRCAELVPASTRVQNATASGGSTVVQVNESKDVKLKIGS